MFRKMSSEPRAWARSRSWWTSWKSRVASAPLTTRVGGIVLHPRRQLLADADAVGRARRLAALAGRPGGTAGCVIGPRESVAPSTSAGWMSSQVTSSGMPISSCVAVDADDVRHQPRALLELDQPDEHAGSGSPAPAGSAAPRRSTAARVRRRPRTPCPTCRSAGRACGPGGWKSSPVAGSRCMRSSWRRQPSQKNSLSRLMRRPRAQVRRRVDRLCSLRPAALACRCRA